ncbi:MAG: hypothetical protein DI536_27705 [Archangium gephyra]|uniref:Uncharacterized protein n=1 Tax=Archangium gephyra TaxID=48 RepID=A0A2W5SWQ6_9BACT|nr:MAG: hypothetical protein DI536_27705 [Archangium gephyra]
MPITTLEERPECRVGHAGSVFVTAWYSELTEAALDMMERHQTALSQRYGKVTLISIVMGATRNPPPDVRERLKRTADFLQDQRIGNFVVVQTRGLSAIIARTFLAALSLMNSENMKVFKTLEDAAEEAKRIPGQQQEVVTNTTLAADLAAFAQLPPPR